MNNDKKLANIIEALGKHSDNSAVSVLEEIGTNCEDAEIRRLTAQALVNRNTVESLNIVINKKGKGIHDLNTSVAMSAINNILELKDKTNVLNVLENTIKKSEDENLKECAVSVKTLIAFS